MRDPYLYEEHPVLINKFGIKDQNHSNLLLPVRR
jgi:hypothetical protein